MKKHIEAKVSLHTKILSVHRKPCNRNHQNWKHCSAKEIKMMSNEAMVLQKVFANHIFIKELESRHAKNFQNPAKKTEAIQL